MTEDKVPQPRREVWLSIALAVARDNLPEPMELTLYADHSPPAVWVRFDAVNEARLWWDHLGFTDSPFPDRGEINGWRWYVRHAEPVVPAPVEPSALADEVVAAVTHDRRLG